MRLREEDSIRQEANNVVRINFFKGTQILWRGINTIKGNPRFFLGLDDGTLHFYDMWT